MAGSAAKDGDLEDLASGGRRWRKGVVEKLPSGVKVKSPIAEVAGREEFGLRWHGHLADPHAELATLESDVGEVAAVWRDAGW